MEIDFPAVHRQFHEPVATVHRQSHKPVATVRFNEDCPLRRLLVFFKDVSSILK